MYDFITALEFLTRIRFSRRTAWSDEDFSRSVPYFPLVGLVIGIVMGAVSFVLSEKLHTPHFMRCTLILLAEILLTGGLMCDGFMDTADGVFSARSRERMLEIMKDSHVGANAVLAICILFLLKISTFLAFDPEELPLVLVGMSVATRGFMGFFIICYPYARKEGIGLLFKQYAKTSYLIFLGVVTVAVLALLDWQFPGAGAVVTAVCTFVLVNIVAKYFTHLLGGLTGDTYGALTECGNVIFLVVAYFLTRY